MDTVLYENRNTHSLMTLKEVEEEFKNCDNLRNDIKSVKDYIEVCRVLNAGHLLPIGEEDIILNYVNGLYDSLGNSGTAPQYIRDEAVRSVYEKVRGLVIRNLKDTSLGFLGTEEKVLYTKLLLRYLKEGY